MANFNFSDNTVEIEDWYKFNHDSDNNEFQIRILVVAANSPTTHLTGPLNKLKRIVVTSIDFNDGRIFSLARQIRLLGYNGTLTVVGNVLPDQFPALFSCGFDTVLPLDILTLHETIELDLAHSLLKVEDFYRKPTISTNITIT